MTKRAVGCVFLGLLSAAAVCGQADDKKDPPSRNPGQSGAAGQREDRAKQPGASDAADLALRLSKELAAIRKKAPKITPGSWADDNLRNVAKELVSNKSIFPSFDSIRRAGYHTKERSNYGVLNGPPSSLRYRDCHDAAVVYSLAADMAKGKRKMLYSNAAIGYYRQYIRLAAVRTKVLQALEKAEEEPAKENSALKTPIFLISLSSNEFFELRPGTYCMTLWYRGGHAYATILADKDGRLREGSIKLAAPLLGKTWRPCRDARCAEAFLKQLLRTLPYSEKVIRNAGDIPPPDFEKYDKDYRKEVLERWNEFRSGLGLIIRPPTRVKKKGGSVEYEIYTYARLGGAVRRYYIRFKDGKFVSITYRTCERRVGDAWFIM